MIRIWIRKLNTKVKEVDLDHNEFYKNVRHSIKLAEFARNNMSILCVGMFSSFVILLIEFYNFSKIKKKQAKIHPIKIERVDKMNYWQRPRVSSVLIEHEYGMNLLT